MGTAAEQALAKLIGVCREGRKEFTAVAPAVRGIHLRLLILEALDQRGEMLDDLHAFAPDCGPSEAVNPGWTSRSSGAATDISLAARCTAGEESTLRAVEDLLGVTFDDRLRDVLDLHTVRLRNLLSKFHLAAGNMQNL